MARGHQNGRPRGPFFLFFAASEKTPVPVGLSESRPALMSSAKLCNDKAMIAHPWVTYDRNPTLNVSRLRELQGCFEV